MTEGHLKMGKRPPRWQDRAIPVFGERDQDHPQVRQDRKERDEAENSRAEQPPQPPGLTWPALARRLRHHGMVVAPEEKFSRRIEKNSRCQQHGDERKGKRISPDVLDAGKDLDRRHPRKLEHERHSELGKSPDEDDGASSKKPRHDQRQRDFAEGQ